MGQADTIAERVHPPFPEHVRGVAQRLRGALVQLFQAAGADPTRPRESARWLGLDKNLAWKASKIARAADPVAAMSYLPGDAGLRKLLDALAKRGAPDALMAQAHEALAAFEEMVTVHCGDRVALEQLLSAVVTGSEQAERLAVARREAFTGNRLTFGIEARLRLSAYIVAPARDDPSLVDICVVTGIVDLRRYRQHTRWPLPAPLLYDDDGNLRKGGPEPIDEDSPIPGLPLLSKFCTSPLPTMDRYEDEYGHHFEMRSGPVGKTGDSTIIFGWRFRGAGAWKADEMNTVGEHPTRLSTPVHQFVTDLYMHRDLPLQMPPETAMYHRLLSASPIPLEHQALPLPEEVHDLGASPPIPATPHLAEYPSIIDHVMERSEWSLDDFAGYRLEMSHPPIPATAVLRYPLAG